MSNHDAYVVLTVSLRMAIDALKAFVYRMRHDAVRCTHGLHRMCVQLQGEVRAWRLEVTQLRQDVTRLQREMAAVRLMVRNDELDMIV
jgi:hypothetical protein